MVQRGWGEGSGFVVAVEWRIRRCWLFWRCLLRRRCGQVGPWRQTGVGFGEKPGRVRIWVRIREMGPARRRKVSLRLLRMAGTTWIAGFWLRELPASRRRLVSWLVFCFFAFLYSFGFNIEGFRFLLLWYCDEVCLQILVKSYFLVEFVVLIASGFDFEFLGCVIITVEIVQVLRNCFFFFFFF